MSSLNSNSDSRQTPTPAQALERHEGHFRGDQGLELFYQSWTASKATRGTLVLTHGMGEHSECYHHTAESLVAMGWSVYAWDLRGHGRSEGKRGYIGEFNQYALDLGYFLRHLLACEKIDGGFALIGHSMGGLITLRHLLNSEGDTPIPRTVSLSSPLLGVAVAVPALKDAAARLLYKFAPSVTLFNEIKYEMLSRDPEFLKSYETDHLRHDKISPGVYLGMIENMDLVKRRAQSIRLPLLIQAAGEDKLVSVSATRDFFPRVGSVDKELLIYEDNYHEIFNDLDRKKVLADLDAFLARTLETTTAQGEKS